MSLGMFSLHFLFFVHLWLVLAKRNQEQACGNVCKTSAQHGGLCLALWREERSSTSSVKSPFHRESEFKEKIELESLCLRASLKDKWRDRIPWERKRGKKGAGWLARGELAACEGEPFSATRKLGSNMLFSTGRDPGRKDGAVTGKALLRWGVHQESIQRLGRKPLSP